MLQTQQLKRAHRLALSTVLLLRDAASGLTTKTKRPAGSRPQMLKGHIWLKPFLEAVAVDFPNNLSSIEANIANFGADPCPNLSKYLEVKYTCTGKSGRL